MYYQLYKRFNIFYLLLIVIVSGCSKTTNNTTVVVKPPVQNPSAIDILAGNNQNGTINNLLQDTIVLRIKPNDTADLSRYSYTFGYSASMGNSNYYYGYKADGFLYVKALWITGTQPLNQVLKFYLWADCNSNCKLLDSVSIMAYIHKPWVSIYSPASTGGYQVLHDLWFTTSNKGIAVGENTDIIRTSDGGVTWVSSPAFRSDLYQLDFADSNTGLVTVTNNYAYITNDGGNTFQSVTWQPAIVGQLASNSYYMIDRNMIYSVGNVGQIVKTTDGGQNWVKYSGFSFINGLRYITCLNKDTCYACGDIAKVVMTVDGGNSWQVQPVLLNNYLNTMFFVDQNLGFAAGQSGGMIRTDNGGVNWSILNTGLKFNIIAIRFFDNLHGLIVSESGEIGETYDSGNTWKKICQANTGVYSLNKAVIKDSKTIFGLQGSIYKYDLNQ